jgi:PAS domain-containing protein
MPKHSAQPLVPAQLRVSAEERLRHGTAPTTHGWPAGAPALTLLHNLASTPASASDALKLLHELQVHQIELDLQQEQAEQDRQQLTEAQERYFALFDLAPFGYITVDMQGQLVEANRMACSWLDLAHETGTALSVEDMFTPDSHRALHDAFARLHAGAPQASFMASPKGGGQSRQVLITPVPGCQLALLAFMPLVPASEH